MAAGFNWATFTWQGTRWRAYTRERGCTRETAGLRWSCAVLLLCKHSITGIDLNCKFGETTRCWAFYSVFWVELHYILRLSAKNHKFTKIYTKYLIILPWSFVQYVQNSAVWPRGCAFKLCSRLYASTHENRARRRRNTPSRLFAHVVVKHASRAALALLSRATTYSGKSGK